MKFWNLKFLEPSWPPQARKWTTLPLCRCYYLADSAVTVQNKTTVLHINCDMWRCGTLTCSSHTGLSVVLGLISDFQFPVWTGLRVVKFKMSHTLAHFTQLSGNLSTLFIYFDVPSFPRSHINYRLETGSIFSPGTTLFGFQARFSPSRNLVKSCSQTAANTHALSSPSSSSLYRVLISPYPHQEGNKPESLSGTRVISTNSRRELSSSFFPAGQCTERYSPHSDRNINLFLSSSG